MAIDVSKLAAQEARRRAIYVAADLAKAQAPEKKDAINAWIPWAEEINAITYDVDRMLTEAAACGEDEANAAKKKYYADMIATLNARFEALKAEPKEGPPRAILEAVGMGEAPF